MKSKQVLLLLGFLTVSVLFQNCGQIDSTLISDSSIGSVEFSSLSDFTAAELASQQPGGPVPTASYYRSLCDNLSTFTHTNVDELRNGNGNISVGINSSMDEIRTFQGSAIVKGTRLSPKPQIDDIEQFYQNGSATKFDDGLVLCNVRVDRLRDSDTTIVLVDSVISELESSSGNIRLINSSITSTKDHFGNITTL
jgi:hypothetical protein